jgi:hypothetical protein
MTRKSDRLKSKPPVDYTEPEESEYEPEYAEFCSDSLEIVMRDILEIEDDRTDLIYLVRMNTSKGTCFKLGCTSARRIEARFKQHIRDYNVWESGQCLDFIIIAIAVIKHRQCEPDMHKDLERLSLVDFRIGSNFESKRREVYPLEAYMSIAEHIRENTENHFIDPDYSQLWGSGGDGNDTVHDIYDSEELEIDRIAEKHMPATKVWRASQKPDEGEIAKPVVKRKSLVTRNGKRR